jgi:integrase
MGMGKLTVASVRGLTKPGRYADGAGLFLDVRGGSRAWVYRYQIEKRERLMSLGSAEAVSLADARAAHSAARTSVLRGVDPLALRKEVQTEKVAPASFQDAAAAYIAAHRAGWRGRTEEHWTRSLAAYAFPAFGEKPVSEINREDILRCLEPMWTQKPVTATNLRNRIELVIDYCIALGWRTSDNNPARWKGGLKALLPAKAKFHETTHRRALAWREAPGFMSTLLDQSGIAARCLAFCILTATRSGEARGCRWSEIDMAARVWTIPGARMKARKPHTVPLSESAMAILAEMSEITTGDLIFFGRGQRGTPLADGTLLDLLRQIQPGATVHGFRSTFSTWAADSGQDATLVEMSLAHAVGNAVSQAYQRSDLLEARRGLMDTWGRFLTMPPADVVPIRRAG